MKMAINPLNRANAAPRCSATSKRSGLPCRAPALKGHHVCRCHGARGGAPRGTGNGRYVHGRFTCEALTLRAEIAGLVRASRRQASLL